MPRTQISLRKGKSPAYKQALFDQIYLAIDLPLNFHPAAIRAPTVSVTP